MGSFLAENFNQTQIYLLAEQGDSPTENEKTNSDFSRFSKECS